MKYLIVLCCLSLYIDRASAQQSHFSKPIIDSAAINHWPSLGPQRAISNDGRYFMYSIDNQPVGSNTLIVKSTEASWQKEFVGIGAGVFSGDNKEFIFQDADTLFFLSLGKSNGLKKVTGVASYNQPENGKGRWLVYQFKNAEQELVIHDYSTAQERRFNGITGYVFNDAVTKILMTTAEGLQLSDLKDGKPVKIWGQKDHPDSLIVSYTMDKNAAQVSFLTTEIKDSISHNTLWYYSEGMKQAEVKATDESPGIESGLKIAASKPKFSEDGRFIYFLLTSNLQIPKPSAEAVRLDVWNWQDSALQETQLWWRNRQNIEYSAAVGSKNTKINRLVYENEQTQTSYAQGDYVVVDRNNNPGDRFWLDRPDSVWLVTLKDGSRTWLPTKSLSEYSFSPDGHYLVYFDPYDGVFTSYNLQTGQVRVISADVPPYLLSFSTDFDIPQRYQDYPSVGIAGWEQSDTSLLVYDNYDIWKLSLNGNHASINITQGYGQKNHIKFRADSDQDGAKRVFNASDSILLSAFNTDNKYNGFYQQALSGLSEPVKLSMGPCTVFHSPGAVIGSNFDNAGMPPVKAGDAGSWVVMRTTATESPNYFLTKDFKNYKPLTDLQPQKKYNWLTSELMSWVQPDGITTQGILYKPENFDRNKKYPVIINYYTQLSHRLYEYPQPEFTGSANINIPWFVSRGYLVFTPDIYYHEFATTESASTTVESAARMLSKLPFVDSLKMGIAGHSWGGTETNYIVTHTHLFAACLSGSGGGQAVDMVSNSLAIKNNGSAPFNDLDRYENRGEGIGATLWQKPDLWIKRSPIFRADQVSTPLLIFYNKADVDWLRAEEFFIALRRLGKPTWMLQYDNGGHLVGGKDAEDFTIRITQFFDHYLKGEPMPVWMAHGIPARLKGIDNGLRLDTSKSQQ